MRNHLVAALAEYAVGNGLIEEEDRIYSINRLLQVLRIEEYEAPEDKRAVEALAENLEELLKALLDDAASRGLVEDGVVARDLLDTEMMNCFVPRPSEMIREFREKYQKDPEEATNWFYRMSKVSDYIRTYRIAKDRKWIYDCNYGKLDITINLSKPEKDPKAIAAAKAAKQAGYPKCQLCIENEGYAGRINHPARANHRIMPITVCGEAWGFQYSPYVYYNEHCIVLNTKHVPMTICREAFEKMFDFVRQFPHYMLASNADLPIVGGSILAHEHFQGGHYEFPMARARIETKVTIRGYEEIDAGILNWPISVLRISSPNADRLVDLADRILEKWRGYTDEASFLFAETDGVPHNTISPVVRKNGDCYEMDLALRNNITTKERPLGVYHPRPEFHHIKKENIGVIEVMGLAILPARLKTELERCALCLLNGRSIREDPETEKHADWIESWLPARKAEISKETVDAILKEEVGKVFVGVLEDAGVFKRTPEGKSGFLRFIDALSE